MTYLKISIPVYKRGKWDGLKQQGRVVVSSEVSELSEGYKELKAQIDKLLDELNAQNRLADDAKSLEEEIKNKAFTLKNLIRDIERAAEHYEDLKIFLQAFGVDPGASRLTFDKLLLLSESSEAEAVSSLIID
ncbi:MULTISPECIES: hypothetical protein [unclassified Microcoleus]|uniref:hypothetical protein n=1 Tax=unclassified Microcoleus TaxID=2642155 RepID=UPI0025CF3188|nr:MULTISPECIES: hypothetical protein [unclassified Microcoleus]